MPEYKQLNFFHLCNEAIIEEGTKKITIVGDFNQLTVQKTSLATDASLFVFSAVINFSGDKGFYNVKIEILAPEGDDILSGMPDVKTQIDDARTTVIWKLAALFKVTGIHQVRVLVDGKPIYETPLTVKNG